MVTNVMMKTCLNQKIIKMSNLIQAMKNRACPKRKLCEGRIFPNAEFSEVWIQHTTWWSWNETYWIFPKPNLSEYLPNVAKCGLNTRHDNREVTLIHLTRAQTLRSDKCATGSITQTCQWLSTLFHANCSAAQVYVVYPRQFIFAPSCRRRPFLQVLQFTEHSEGYFEKFFVYLMMTNVMVKSCLNQKIIKNSNLIQAMKNSVGPTPNVTRRPIFSESRIFRSLGIVDSTHDMTIVKWHLSNFSRTEFVRTFTECSEEWIEHTTW